MKILFKILLVICLIVGVKYVFLRPANGDVRYKLHLIGNELSRLGYINNWIIISGTRPNWYNHILPNASKTSNHIKGNAIDIFVFDLTWDGKFNQEDIDVFEKALRSVERRNPDLKGGFGTYRSKDFLSKHMIHIDTDGSNKRWY